MAAMESSVRVAVVVQVVSENDCCTHLFRAFQPPIVPINPARPVDTVVLQEDHTQDVAQPLRTNLDQVNHIGRLLQSIGW